MKEHDYDWRPGTIEPQLPQHLIRFGNRLLNPRYSSISSNPTPGTYVTRSGRLSRPPDRYGNIVSH